MKPFAPASWFHLLALLALALLLNGCTNENNSKARIRLLNVSPGYSSLDLYVNDGDSDTDSQKFTGVNYEIASEYTALDSDTYTVKFKRSGVTGTLRTLSAEKLADDTHATYVAFGSNGHFGTMKIAEDQSDADSGQTKLAVLNTAEAGTLDVYLTDASVALEDATPTFSSVAAATASSAVSIDSGTYRLRVTGAGDTDDLRLDVADVTLVSKQIVSLILTATQGGVLVNALLLPQQGSPTINHNTKALVRGAVGIANGAVVSASIGGVKLLTNSAVGVIGSRYSQVTAGSAAVSLGVDGVAVVVANQTLTAGGDYTLLVWSNGNGTQTTLISDDNRLPSASGKAKIRVMNGISALDTPITLAVDFSPVSEDVALGQAADFAEIDSGADYQLDISNSTNGVNLLSKTSISLQDAGVYTMFMFSNGTTVGGTLRKDR
jgi:hypothetical protein